MNTSGRLVLGRLALITLASTFILTGIQWPGSLGIVLLLLPTLLALRDWRRRFFLALLVVQAVLQIFIFIDALQDGVAFTRKPPKLWMEIAFPVFWLVCVVAECVRWRKNKSQPIQQVIA